MSETIWEMFVNTWIPKKKKIIRPATPCAIYEVDLTCSNCGVEYFHQIPKGTTKEEYVAKTKCPHCGCKRLRTYSGSTYY